MNNRVKRKILFVIPSLGGGGAERVTICLANNLDRSQYDIKFVVFEDADAYSNLDPAIDVICLHKRNRWDFLKLIYGLRKFIKFYQPDVVISAIYYTNLIALLSSINLRKKSRLLITEHSYPTAALQRTRLEWLKRLLIRVLYNNATKIIAVSAGIKQSLVKDLKVSSTRIEVIYNPVSLREIEQKVVSPSNPCLKSEESVIRIISAGRFVFAKRFDRLLRAFAMVKEKIGNVHLIILGEGELLEQIKALAVDLKIGQDVTLPGFQANPYAWFADSDMFVLSSDYEGFPMVILEAMACGVPVVSIDCHSGPNEIISDGETGILVSQDKDCQGLAKAMIYLLERPELRETMAHQARQLIYNYDISRIIKKYEMLFTI